MNYISLIDELGIDIETITTLDDTKIIRLKKQLKAKAVLDNKSNLGELASIIDQLKDETTRKHHIFIEKHKWLKQVITGDYGNIPQNSISIHHESIADVESLKYFLSPYLKEHVKPFLSETLTKGKYILLVNFVKSNILFTEEIEQLIISLFSSKLNYAKVYIESGKLIEKHYPVAFITNRNFIKCLSQYPNSFDDEVNELNSVIIDTYNSKRKKVTDDTFIFAAKTMVAFGELDISNYMLKDILTTNAAIASPYAYNNARKSSKSKSGTGVGIWSIIVFLILIVRIGVKVFKSDSSPTNYYDQYDRISIPNSNYQKENILEAIKEIQKNREAEENRTITTIQNEVEETVLESTERNTNTENSTPKTVTLPDYNSKHKSKDHVRFIYSLKLKTNRKTKTKSSIKATSLNAFTNPYPKTFNTLQSSDGNKTNTYSLVKNNSRKDLIVFRLTNGIDQSLIIPKSQSRYLNIKTGDSVLFYTGHKFVADRFSHFKQEAGISRLYKIETLENNSEINILPQTMKVSFNKDFKTNTTTRDTTLTDHIKTKKIDLELLSIDNIYSRWYRAKYN